MAVDTKEKRRDLREMPAYGIVEAAHYLGIPKATLRSWVLGRHYPTGTGKRFFRPIIELADKEQRLLSFEESG
jgi:DNA-binding transcriptional regulator YiaG